MKYLKNNLLLFSFLLMISCEKKMELPNTPIPGLGGETWVKGALDKWLDQTFLDPYNIEVKYKWDPYELNYLRNLVPVKEEQVIPVMTAVNDLWIKPFQKAGGETFLKTYIPKQFVLAGSAEYNNNGTIILGQAEGGRKVVLLQLNKYDSSNIKDVQGLLHTIHHEFAHILHQTKLYPLEWKSLNPEWYTATWFNSTDADAWQQGLISAYAKSSPDEDFAETVSFLLVYGQDSYNSIVNSPLIPRRSGEILKQKQEMVIEYFNRNYHINFPELQKEIQDAIHRK